MGLLVKKRSGAWLLTGMAKLSFVTFLVALSLSFVDTIWAVYIESFLHNPSLVGFFSGFLSLVSFISFFVLVPLIERKNKAVLYSYALLLTFVVYVLISLNKGLVPFVMLMIAMVVLYSLRSTSFGIIVKDKSKKKYLSRNEGLIYTFTNISWVIGPLIAGIVAANFGIPIIFLMSAGVMLLGFFFFRRAKFSDNNIMKETEDNVLENFFNFFKNKNRTIIYFISAGVTLWWSLIYIYIPLMMYDSGMNEMWIGVFLFFTALPLILLEYPFSNFAGRYGTRVLFQIGYFIVAMVAFISFFLNRLVLILVLLVVGSIGIAMLEPTTEAYFFDVLKTKKDENRYYGPYNTAIETGLIFGKIPAAVLLLFLPMKYIFILYGLFMLSLFVLATKSKNVIENRKIS